MQVHFFSGHPAALVFSIVLPAFIFRYHGSVLGSDRCSCFYTICQSTVASICECFFWARMQLSCFGLVSAARCVLVRLRPQSAFGRWVFFSGWLNPCFSERSLAYRGAVGDSFTFWSTICVIRFCGAEFFIYFLVAWWLIALGFCSIKF